MKKDVFTLVLMFMILSGCNNQDYSDTASRNVIMSIIEEKSNHLIEAATNLDMDSIVSFYDENVSAIEQGHMHPNSKEFIATYRTAVESVLEVHRIDIINHRINILNDVVIYEAKLRQDLTLKSRERIEAINVITLIYTLINKEWKIVHHHGSFPVQE